jgi:hypothetical protein
MSVKKGFWDRVTGVRWKLVGLRFICLLALLGGLAVATEGMKCQFPIFAVKLWRLKILNCTGIIPALVIITATFFLVGRALRVIRNGVPARTANKRFDYAFPLLIGLLCLFLDGFCFYLGLVRQSIFGDLTLNKPALAFSVLYSCVMLSLAFLLQTCKEEYDETSNVPVT